MSGTTSGRHGFWTIPVWAWIAGLAIGAAVGLLLFDGLIVALMFGLAIGAAFALAIGTTNNLAQRDLRKK